MHANYSRVLKKCYFIYSWNKYWQNELYLNRIKCIASLCLHVVHTNITQELPAWGGGGFFKYLPSCLVVQGFTKTSPFPVPCLFSAYMFLRYLRSPKSYPFFHGLWFPVVLCSVSKLSLVLNGQPISLLCKAYYSWCIC